MNSNVNLSLITLLAGVIMLGGGCSGASNTGSQQNAQSNRVAETQPTAQSSRLPENVAMPTPGHSSQPEDVPVGSIATPTESYKTAHTLRARKDVEGLKTVMSKEILEFFTEMGKAQKQPLDAMLLQLVNKPQARTAEVRNEKITGNRAVIEFKDENDKWTPMDFVKEGGGWKLTLPPASAKSKKPPAAPSTKP